MGILNRAELLLQAKNYSGSGDWLDESGNGHDAQFGTGVPGTNDPQSLPWDGENYVKLPSVTGNHVTTIPASTFTGDISIRIKLMSTGWASLQTWLNFNLSLYCYVNAGAITVNYLNSAGGNRASTSTAFTLVDGVETVIGYDVDVSTGAVSWLQDGVEIDTDTIAMGAGRAGTVLSVGAAASGTTPWGGDIYYAEVREGVGGALKARYDAADAEEPFATQVGSVDGLTWTYQRSGSGLYVVDQPSFGLHTDDYFEIADHADLDFADTEDFTLLAAVRPISAATNMRIAGKRNGAAAGYHLGWDSTTVMAVTVEDTTGANFVDTSAAVSMRSLYVFAGRRDDSTPELEAFVDGVGSGSPTTSATANLSNGVAFRIGTTSVPNNFFNGEITAVALFREALTDAEIVSAGQELLGLGASARHFTVAGIGQLLLTGG